MGVLGHAVCRIIRVGDVDLGFKLSSSWIDRDRIDQLSDRSRVSQFGPEALLRFIIIPIPFGVSQQKLKDLFLQLIQVFLFQKTEFEIDPDFPIYSLKILNGLNVQRFFSTDIVWNLAPVESLTIASSNRMFNLVWFTSNSLGGPGISPSIYLGASISTGYLSSCSHSLPG